MDPAVVMGAVIPRLLNLKDEPVTVFFEKLLRSQPTVLSCL